MINENKTEQMTRARTRRTWRRVGWGALIGLGALIAIVAVALWLGPPRDPKCFALDDEDFGLGFKVGDPWDPDAFEAAMESHYLTFKGSPFEVPQGYFDFNTTSWVTADGLIQVVLMSQSKSPITTLMSCVITVSRPKDNKLAQQILNEAESRFPDNALNRAFYKQALAAVEVSNRYPELRSAKDVGFASSPEEVIAAYGRPLLTVTMDNCIDSLTYICELSGWTFGFYDGNLTTVVSHPGYSNGDIRDRLNAWRYCFRPMAVMSSTKNASQHLEPSQDKGKTE